MIRIEWKLMMLAAAVSLAGCEFSGRWGNDGGASNDGGSAMGETLSAGFSHTCGVKADGAIVDHPGIAVRPTLEWVIGMLRNR